MRNSFEYKKEWMEALWVLPKQVKGEVNEAIVRYGITEELIPLKALARAVFSLIKADMDKDREDMERKSAISERNRVNVMHRWEKQDSDDNDNPEENTEKETESIRNGYDRNTTVIRPYIRNEYDRNTTVKNDSRARYKDNNIIEVDNNNNNVLLDINENNIKEEKKVERKEEIQDDKSKEKKGKNKSPTPTLEDRAKMFEESLNPFIERYGERTVKDFLDYWSEPNKSHSRMRFELERTWDTGRRIAKWKANELKWNNLKQTSNEGTGTSNERRRGTDATAIRAEDYEPHF